MAKKKLDAFSRFTSRTSALLGHAGVFVGALAVLVVWAISGPLLGFSDTWQLVINTGTTIVTFLMVFIIQNTQNRDNLAINVKLDTIMKKLNVTAEELLEAEDQSDVELEKQIKQAQRPRQTRTKSTRRKRRG